MADKKQPKKKNDVERLAALFEGFNGAHGTHGMPDKEPDGLKWTIKRTARTVRTPVTLDLWQQHVAGKQPLGVTPIREDNTCSWGSIDFDVYDVNLVEIVEQVHGLKYPLVPCISKSGGLHLFAFFKEPELAADVIAVLRDVAASLGMADCEIFPKQNRILAERNDLGNWMVMPYFGGDYGGKLRMQHGLKRTGAEMTLGEFCSAAEAARTTVLSFAQLCEGRRTRTSGTMLVKDKDGKPRRVKSTADFRDGPPCLQHLTAGGVQSEGRKRSLFMMALYYKRADEEGWKARVEAANQNFFNPPLPSEEVIGVIRSCERKNYEYTCKEEPMRSHCDSILCRTRRFGVGRGGQFPQITGLRMLETEPVIWFVDIEGEVLELDTDGLHNYQRFQRACMERLRRVYAPMRNDVWLSVLAEVMDKVVPVPAPPEVSLDGRFHEMLVEFLTNRSRGERFEDLWGGRPWENAEEGRHYFQLRNFEKFLAQEKFEPKLTRPQIGQRIRKLGGDDHYFNQTKPGLRTFWVPSEVVQAAPEIDPPKIEDDIA